MGLPSPNSAFVIPRAMQVSALVRTIKSSLPAFSQALEIKSLMNGTTLVSPMFFDDLESPPSLTATGIHGPSR